VPGFPRPQTFRPQRSSAGANAYEPDKMPIRTMPAAWGNTLAPWVLRVGTATVRGTRTGRRTPAPLTPVITRARLTGGSQPTAPPRRHPTGSPGPGRPALPGADHRLAGPRRPAPWHRRACRPAAGRRPGAAPGPHRPCHPAAPGHPRPCDPAAPGRPPPCHPAAPDQPQGRRPGAGQPRADHLVPGRPGAAQGRPRPSERPRPCHPVAGGRGAAPGPARSRRRAAPPTPGTAVPGQ
jgi:hypothetical protein